MITDPDTSPVIIYGAARSGTTYLVYLLNSHPQVQVADETRIFVWAHRAMDELLENEQIFFRNKQEFVNHLERSFQPVIRDFIRSLKPGARFWGDKNPHYVAPANYGCLENILTLFPNAHFIHIVRDGRDVVASAMRGVWRGFNRTHTMWNTHVKRGRQFGKKLSPGRYFELKYEDLIHDDEEFARRIFEFLGIEMDPAVVAFCKAQQAKRTPYCKPTRDLATGVTKSEWSQVLSAVDRLQSLKLIGAQLVRSGYETRASLAEKIRATKYEAQIERLRKIVRSTVPMKSTVLVLSKGDNDLVRIPGRKGRHFPQSSEGWYSGHHPSDSREAVEHLESLRRKGARYLVIPSTSAWWLKHYRGFATHLKRHGKLLVRDRNAGFLFALHKSNGHVKPSSARRGRRLAKPKLVSSM